MVVQPNAHIGMVCIDLEKSIKLNKKFLGMKEKFGLNHLDIVVDDIQAFYQDMVDKGGEEFIDILPGTSICRSRTMWFHDPDGNQVEVHQYTDISMQRVGRELPEGAVWP